MIWKMTNKDLFEALRTFEKEKGIPMDYMLQNIEKAISVACKNYYGGNENVVFKVDPEKNSFDAKRRTVTPTRLSSNSRFSARVECAGR